MDKTQKKFMRDIDELYPMPTLTDVNISKILGLHRETIYRWRLKGKGPKFVKIGKKQICMKEDFFTWFFSCYSTNDYSADKGR